MKRALAWYGVVPLLLMAPLSVGVTQQQMAMRHVPKERSALDRLVSIELKGVPVKQAIDELGMVAGVEIQYRASLFDPAGPLVTLNASNISLGDALQRVLSETLLQAVSSIPNVITIKPKEKARVAVNGTIRGTVVSAKTKQPVSGAMVSLDGESGRVVTSADGTFQIAIASGKWTVRVRAMGFVRYAKAVTVTEATATTLTIELDPNANVLSEVVVTGTVIATKRKAIPTPITVITADDIEKRGITRLEQLFRGEVPGVIAIDQGSNPYVATNSLVLGEIGQMMQTKVVVRGASTIYGGDTPLKTYIDGVELFDQAYLGTIDPNSIERIEIVTGPQAATIYGSGAMGGVMQIYTKRGGHASSVESRLSLKYGVMQSNVSSKLTPTHNHTFNVSGGAMDVFSYAGTFSYKYTGQWQPKLFNRMVAASLGATHMRGPFMATLSVSTSVGANGNASRIGGILGSALSKSGEWSAYAQRQAAQGVEGTISRSASHAISFNVDFHPWSWWQHHITLGRSANRSTLDPSRALFNRPYDSTYLAREATMERITPGYNTSFIMQQRGILSTNVTVGVNGSIRRRTAMMGFLSALSNQSMLNPQLRMVPKDANWGSFLSWQLGFFNQLYTTVSIRGEQNSSYGQEVKIDWTPTVGIAYTLSAGDLTLKLMSSYGRATRAPRPQHREGQTTINANYAPSQRYSILPNPDVRPERSRGPQGGIELYYGNRVTFTVNRYKQRVTDLITNPIVDSIELVAIATGDAVKVQQRQWINIAEVEQHGWELTGSTYLGRISIKGTYSWTDSRIRSSPFSSYPPGAGFNYIPTHTGNTVISYAHSGTTVALTTNYIGTSARYSSSDLEYSRSRFYRHSAYTNRKVFPRNERFEQAAYAKADLSGSHRISGNITATFLMTNVANNLSSEYDTALYPTLGRQTSFGVSLRL